MYLIIPSVKCDYNLTRQKSEASDRILFCITVKKNSPQKKMLYNVHTLVSACYLK